jgi:hypothetical protein
MNLVWVGLGQEIREDKVKLIVKAKQSSDPPYAIKLLKVFGIDVNKICQKEGIGGNEYPGTGMRGEQMYIYDR